MTTISPIPEPKGTHSVNTNETQKAEQKMFNTQDTTYAAPEADDVSDKEAKQRERDKRYVEYLVDLYDSGKMHKGGGTPEINYTINKIRTVETCNRYLDCLYDLRDEIDDDIKFNSQPEIYTQLIKKLSNVNQVISLINQRINSIEAGY